MKKWPETLSFLHKAVKLLPPVSLKGMADLDMVLDEMWSVTQERDELPDRSGQYGGICPQEPGRGFCGDARLSTSSTPPSVFW